MVFSPSLGLQFSFGHILNCLQLIQLRYPLLGVCKDRLMSPSNSSQVSGFLFLGPILLSSNSYNCGISLLFYVLYFHFRTFYVTFSCDDMIPSYHTHTSIWKGIYDTYIRGHHIRQGIERVRIGWDELDFAWPGPGLR